MSRSRGEQPPAYRGNEVELEGSSSSAAIPLPIQDNPDHSGEVLPEYHDSVGESMQSVAIPLPIQEELDGSGGVLPGYYDGVDESTQSVAGHNRGEGARGVGGGDTEGEADADAPPGFEVYVPKVKRISTLRAGGILTISHDEHLNTDGEALYRWLLEQRSRPPRVHICIKGTHYCHMRKRWETDFDLDYDVTYLLLEQNDMGEPTLATIPPNQRAHRGHGRSKSIAKDLEEGRTVRDWADQYCEDQSTFKEFLMKKVVVGYDWAYLKGQIKQCIRSTGYTGLLTIDFPTCDKQVKVYPANRISKLRKTEWLRPIFYITFLWIFAWPYLWFMTKRYHVATMTWRMSRRVRDESGATRRECVLTEDEWMRRLGPAINRAAAG